jgi:hypothetical protein
MSNRRIFGLILAVAALSTAIASGADESPNAATPPKDPPRSSRQEIPPVEVPKELEPMFKEATALNPQKTVYLDKANNRLLLKTRVCLREGLLEMLICKARTKEHESILTIDTDAYVIHGSLVAIGAKPGSPVRFRPEYQPPQGDKINIWLNWVDAAGKSQRVEAQSLVRGMTRRYFVEPLEALPDGLTLAKDLELKYDPNRKEIFWFGTMTQEQLESLLKLSKDGAFQKILKKIHKDSQPRQMQADFIFGGSGFYQAKDGTNHYQAEQGNLVCVANFGDAMIDVSIRSSEVNSEASFEPYTERVPPLNTVVIVELIPAKSDAAKE